MQRHDAAQMHGGEHQSAPSPARVAFSATVHCLTGCGIGEVLGLVLATALGWHDVPSILLAVVLAFIFGYGLTLRPLLAGGMGPAQALRLALAADTLSIVVMEIVDNAIILIVPGAMDAGLTSLLFWGSLAIALAIAFAAAFPVNLWLIRQGRGHAVVHRSHSSHSSHSAPVARAGSRTHTGQYEQPHGH